MRQTGIQKAPDAGNMTEILRLAVTHHQAGENADDLGVSLRAQHRIGVPECARIYARDFAVMRNHGFGERGRNIAPRIGDVAIRIHPEGICHAIQNMTTVMRLDSRVLPQ
mgnify:CR=1 FL=1